MHIKVLDKYWVGISQTDWKLHNIINRTTSYNPIIMNQVIEPWLLVLYMMVIWPVELSCTLFIIIGITISGPKYTNIYHNMVLLS